MFNREPILMRSPIVYVLYESCIVKEAAMKISTGPQQLQTHTVNKSVVPICQDAIIKIERIFFSGRIMSHGGVAVSPIRLVALN